jgi:hypothetical protein
MAYSEPGVKAKKSTDFPQVTRVRATLQGCSTTWENRELTQILTAFTRCRMTLLTARSFFFGDERNPRLRGWPHGGFRL